MVQNMPQDVLIVDTDAQTTPLVLECLAAKAIRGTVVHGAKAATDRIERRPWDLAIIDLDGPDAVPETGCNKTSIGIEIVRQVRQHYPDLPVVALNGDGAAKTVVRVMREGCADYLVKPLDRPMVESMIDSILPSHAVPLAAADEADGRCLYRIAGRSPRLFETIALAKKAAPTSLPVLITGETGTGKELVSYLIHRTGVRAYGPYVRVNCAALSESLLESELFGHERGAFTGAVAQRKGCIERAHGGTLLLDEISETGPRLQAELLRVLEQQDFERVGGSEPVTVNVRVISTTNRDLGRETLEGRFRSDLYWRLCGIHISVPPLRQRKEDIPVLVWHFVNQFAREVRRSITQLDPEMMEILLRYDWPGNVRQLRNVVRTALVVGNGPVLSLTGAPWMQAELAANANGPGRPTSLCLREVERETILAALQVTESHQAKAASLLGITDRTLREKLRRYRQEGTLAPTPTTRSNATRTGAGRTADGSRPATALGSGAFSRSPRRRADPVGAPPCGCPGRPRGAAPTSQQPEKAPDPTETAVHQQPVLGEKPCLTVPA